MSATVPRACTGPRLCLPRATRSAKAHSNPAWWAGCSPVPANGPGRTPLRQAVRIRDSSPVRDERSRPRPSAVTVGYADGVGHYGGPCASEWQVGMVLGRKRRRWSGLRPESGLRHWSHKACSFRASIRHGDWNTALRSQFSEHHCDNWSCPAAESATSLPSSRHWCRCARSDFSRPGQMSRCGSDSTDDAREASL